MPTYISLVIILLYFLLLIAVSYLTTRRSNNESFFNANRTSPWYLVAFGMIGTSLSGVTFVSIPGEVGNTSWTYLMLVVGNCLGYILIGFFLLPLFYKRGLVSIYSWLGERYGNAARHTGSFFFLISQLIGASFRLFLVVGVLQLAVFDAIGIPFAVTVAMTIALVWLYTKKGGIKTIIWTDTLQTIFMLLSVCVTIYVVCSSMQLSLFDAIKLIDVSDYSNVFDFDWKSGQNTIKQILAGIAITVAINGLDQNMMQKNLTCKSLRAGKTNVFAFSVLFLLTNIIFLSLGALLYIYASSKNISLSSMKSDDVFPFLSLNYFGPTAAIIFLLGITAAAYSSVDSSLTSMTTSFCVDVLKINTSNEASSKTRRLVHFGFSLLMIAVIVIFKEINSGSVVTAVFKAVGYTYGPILGLFLFGWITKYKIKGNKLAVVAILSPFVAYILNIYSKELFAGYVFGFEILLVNAAICFIGLLLCCEKRKTYQS